MYAKVRLVSFLLNVAVDCSIDNLNEATIQ